MTRACRPVMLAAHWFASQPEVPMISFVLGAIAGSVVTVVVPKVFAFVAAKVAAVKAKV